MCFPGSSSAFVGCRKGERRRSRRRSRREQSSWSESSSFTILYRLELPPAMLPTTAMLPPAILPLLTKGTFFWRTWWLYSSAGYNPSTFTFHFTFTFFNFHFTFNLIFTPFTFNPDWYFSRWLRWPQSFHFHFPFHLHFFQIPYHFQFNFHFFHF